MVSKFENGMPKRETLDKIESSCSGWSLFNLCDTISWLINSVVKSTLGMQNTVSANNVANNV